MKKLILILFMFAVLVGCSTETRIVERTIMVTVEPETVIVTEVVTQIEYVTETITEIVTQQVDSEGVVVVTVPGYGYIHVIAYKGNDFYGQTFEWVDPIASSAYLEFISISKWLDDRFVSSIPLSALPNLTTEQRNTLTRNGNYQTGEAAFLDFRNNDGYVDFNTLEQMYSDMYESTQTGDPYTGGND